MSEHSTSSADLEDNDAELALDDDDELGENEELVMDEFEDDGGYDSTTDDDVDADDALREQLYFLGGIRYENDNDMDSITRRCHVCTQHEVLRRYVDTIHSSHRRYARAAFAHNSSATFGTSGDGEYLWHPTRIYSTLTKPFRDKSIAFRSCPEHWLTMRLLTHGVLVATQHWGVESMHAEPEQDIEPNECQPRSEAQFVIASYILYVLRRLRVDATEYQVIKLPACKYTASVHYWLGKILPLFSTAFAFVARTGDSMDRAIQNLIGAPSVALTDDILYEDRLLLDTSLLDRHTDDDDDDDDDDASAATKRRSTVDASCSRERKRKHRDALETTNDAEDADDDDDDDDDESGDFEKTGKNKRLRATMPLDDSGRSDDGYESDGDVTGS